MYLYKIKKKGKMDINYYKGDVFITKLLEGYDEYIEAVYTNQYAADQAASKFNKKAIEKGITARMKVVCRPLYE